ncbi:ADP-ribosylglycohydrolase family protein [Chromohalobacter canadensis]|uniref:ADP-ribosylglycohydrolase family protein n=1 Tax=Chromohalobacter canadensis TaxID=141389 RepID=UPI0021C12AF7|nr:ADP-ribosylglycohydrolase family protein [Chromohalobacter canadensis]MCT8467215.1 ADP-ribosylglycohydrolase family protein [Chromohalobacter canadensis]MCT8471037.1 ADP-ribosylglycohydrolase family protein [Chromohalobacter canadensis]MCT8497712.1 ADP-ribosylglycohydrolase family protein [Chromohalobacter canadensis]
MNRKKQNRLSAEWAAYGDALGFMTELADASRVQYRIGVEEAQNTVPWKRKVGGYNGVTVKFPAGTYSDDTQLRLSTSRSIRGDGSFNVAAFAKVELPAWANYALGAGIGTKEAAANLARTSATWYSNFFNSKKATYISAGGNGAAMRIQPHIWAAPDLSAIEHIFLDVIRNSVCTHGHVRGIVGACFHAVSLSFAILNGRTATFVELKEMIDNLRSISDIVNNDGDLRMLWLGVWSENSKVLFEEAVTQVVKEMVDDFHTLEPLAEGILDDVYPQAVEALGGLEQSSRGSGTKTAILASFASSLADVSAPKEALLQIVNVLGSDTDSIATMAGAIIGACTDSECEGAVQDRKYIQAEAERLALIAKGEKVSSFRYPNLRSWKPVRAAVDSVGMLDGHLWLNGIAPIEKVDHSSVTKVGNDMMGWFRLPFGQSILVRFRPEPRVLPWESAVNEWSRETSESRSTAEPPDRLQDLFEQDGRQKMSENGNCKVDMPADLEGLTLNEMLQKIMADGFSPEMIGRALLQQVDDGGKDFVERGIALTSNVLTAYEARAKRRRK